MTARRGAKEVTAIAVGGMLGASLRWALTMLLPHSGPLHWGTPVANVAGTGLLTGVVVHIRRTHGVHPPLSDLLEVGFCGGLTTFSTFATEIVKLLETRHVTMALAYAVSTFVACLVSAGSVAFVVLRTEGSTR